MKKLIEGLPFYQDKLHEETVFGRFNEILTKVRVASLSTCDMIFEVMKARANKSSNKPDSELKEFETVR